MPEPDPEAVSRPRRQKPPRGPLLALLLVLGLVGAVAAYYLTSRPILVFTNRLASPVRIVVDSGEAKVIGPGASGRLALPARTAVAMWELVRPLSADGRPMGEAVRGAVVLGGARGKLHRSATPRGTHGDYFAPLITNASDTLLRVKVNAGLEGALDCDCAVRPGARRVFIGYYRLYRNSTVEVRTGQGRRATFRDLGPSVVAPDAAIGLRFESRDLNEGKAKSEGRVKSEE